MAQAATRTLLIGGNWKCNLTKTEATELANGLKKLNTSKVDVVVSPISLHLDLVSNILKGEDAKDSESNVMVSSQNVSATGTGAYTGEIAPTQLLDSGINWTIIGHSERREYYNETDEIVKTKITNALNAGLNVIACLGETADERKANDTEKVIKRQLEAIVNGVSEESQWKQMVIAYEPVWAIGKNPDGTSRKPCDSAEAQNVCLNYIRVNLPANVKDNVRILYGGSVKPGNAAELIAKADIDGFLVGGASLKANDFGGIIKAAQDSLQ